MTYKIIINPELDLRTFPKKEKKKKLNLHKID